MKSIRIFITLAILVLIVQKLPAQVPTHVPNWPYVTRTDFFAERAVPIFGYDGDEQHLYYNTLTGEVDKFLLDRSFFQGWPAIMADTIVFENVPIIVDTDHDGHDEMVTIGDLRDSNRHYYYSLIYIFDDNGSVMPGWPVQVQHMTFNVSDLDADNEYEIIGYSFLNDTIYCFDGNGQPKPGWPISFHLPGADIGLDPLHGSVGDLDLDGKNEFILSGAWDIFAFRYDGSLQPGFHITAPYPNSYFYNGTWPPALADLDLDGNLEIITSGYVNYDGFTAIYDHNGNPKSGWPQYYPGRWVMNAITPADIDGDGIPEIGIALGVYYDNQELNFVHINGDTLYGWPSYYFFHPNDDLIIVDVNGDRRCEIFSDFDAGDTDSLGTYSLFYGLDYMGYPLSGYPIRVLGIYFKLPPTFSLNPESHRLYMALAEEQLSQYPNTDTLFIDLYQFPDSTGPTTEWPMFGHDNLLTRNYNFIDNVTAIHGGEEPIPKSFILKQN